MTPGLARAEGLPRAAAYAEELISAAREKGLADSMQWIRLAHYEKKVLGGYESQADAAHFFASPEGKRDPSRELEATILAFFSPAPASPEDPEAPQHPQCRFPARYLWLKAELGFDPARLTEQPCPRFEKFKTGTRAKSVSVVFSSYYLNNPSSAFGHSFIRLNKSEHPSAGAPTRPRNELLDYGINYAAVMDGANPVVYAFKGMFGLYPGTFTSVPYYYKVREYNDYETRDLWEYDVELTPRQIEMLVAHIWELGPTYFDYWYLTENCSYHVLTALEAANPSLTLTKRQNKIVIPVDTIKVIMAEPGFVRAVRLRPSVRAHFDRRVEALPAPRLADLHRLTESMDPATLDPSLPDAEKVALLDAAADFVDSRYSREILDRESPAARWKQGFLLARAQIPVASQEIAIPISDRESPHLSHGSRRADLEAGYSRELGSFQRLAYRFSLHDLLDPRVGYPEQAQIEMFGARIRHNARGNGVLPGSSLWIDDAMIFNITSLSPVHSFNSSLSWRASLTGRRFYDRTCDYCFGPNLEAGGGYAFKPFRSVPLAFFVLGEGQFAISPGFKGTHFRPGVGPAAGVRLHLSDSLISVLRAGYRYQGWVENGDTYDADFQVRWAFVKDWAVNLRTAAYPNSREASLGLLFYH